MPGVTLKELLESKNLKQDQKKEITLQLLRELQLLYKAKYF